MGGPQPMKDNYGNPRGQLNKYVMDEDDWLMWIYGFIILDYQIILLHDAYYMRLDCTINRIVLY